MASPAIKNISVTRGDNLTEDFFFKFQNGDPIDITGWDAEMHVRRQKDDGVTLLDLSVGSGNLQLFDTSGKITLTLDDIDTKNINFNGDALVAVYDMQLTTDTGTVLTPVEGNFTILKDVTRDA